ncbi:unnamed protein product [Rotaria sp. Silwood2]|nr:unnamed protein product [Rotaria sp. Silwood2]
MTLYRGQSMTTEEFDALKRSTNQLISVNTFLSTTTDREAASIFSGEGSSYSGLISVVFEILVDSNCEIALLPPFADISNLSHMKDENEILLSMATVMQVVLVKKINQTTRTIYLRMCRHDNHTVAELEAYLFNEIRKTQSNESCYIHQHGTLLFNMGEYNKAEQMFNMVSNNENSLDDAMRPIFIFVARLAERISR